MIESRLLEVGGILRLVWLSMSIRGSLVVGGVGLVCLVRGL